MNGAPTWRGYVLMVAVSGLVAAVVSLTVVFLFGPRPGGGEGPGHSGGTAAEEGVAEVPVMGESKKGEMQVFYRAPFASPPKLTFPEGLPDDCFVVEQKADSFKLGRDVSTRGLYQTVARVKWRAEGLPAR